MTVRRRLAWLWAVAFFVPGIPDASDEFRGDSAVYVEGGRMPLIRSRGCGLVTRGATYGGTGARFEVPVAGPTTGPWQNRAVMAGSLDLRGGTIDGERGPLATGRAWLAFGWDSSYAAFRLGTWALGENERWTGFGSLSLRFGPRNRYFRLSLFDQPSCFLADCGLGAELGFPLGRSGPLRVGGSTLLATRAYVLAPIDLGPSGPTLLLGTYAGFDPTFRDKWFALAFGLAL